MKMTPLPALAALFAAAAFAGDSSVPGAPVYAREEVADPASWIPLHCREEVRAAFETIWQDCNRGRATRECAFRIDRAREGPGIEIVFMPPDDTPDTREVRQRTVDVLPTRTLAIAHTHPEGTQPGIGRDDDEVPVSLNYVVQGRAGGLYVWDRDLDAARRLRGGTSWREPCPEKHLAAEREKLSRLRAPGR